MALLLFDVGSHLVGSLVLDGFDRELIEVYQGTLNPVRDLRFGRSGRKDVNGIVKGYDMSLVWLFSFVPLESCLLSGLLRLAFCLEFEPR